MHIHFLRRIPDYPPPPHPSNSSASAGYRAGNRAQRAGIACDAHRMQRARASTLTLDSPHNHPLFVSLDSLLTCLPPLTQHRILTKKNCYSHTLFSRRCSSAAGWGPPSSAAGDAHGLVRRGGCGAGLDVPEPYSSAFAMWGDTPSSANLTGAIRILEGKNASTHIACWPFRLSIVNEYRRLRRPYPAGSVRALLSRWIARGAEGAAREARYVGVGKTDEGARWEPVGLAPAMYVRIPPHAALHFCAVSYGYSCWVYAWCIALFPIPLRTVYAGSSMVGTSLMLLSCSSSGAGVGTVRQGVRGVCGQNVLWEGYYAHGAPVYNGSAWGTPQGTMQAAGDMLQERMARDAWRDASDAQNRKSLSTSTYI
ncbi:hypothetical protein B0H13DRAFT_2264099 [Mycena leptocephala]|nr:hypothetical protein B0H13DRAFT_2264099 [Mycena leptocephala]